MKILSVQDIREADRYTIANEPIESYELMKRAAGKAASFICAHFKEKSFLILCGTGNNGGDGLVIANLLFQRGASVRVAVLEFSENKSIDFQRALVDLSKSIECVFINKKSFCSFDWGSEEIIIDAMLGSGINKPPGSWFAEFIQMTNSQSRTTIAIDFPSGLFADQDSSLHAHSIINASVTLTFEVPKWAMLMPENAPFCGRWVILPIGLHPQFLEEVIPLGFLIDESILYSLIRPRKAHYYKNIFGHVLLIAGSIGKFGASILAAKGILRSGCGLATALVPLSEFHLFHHSVPEIMLIDRQSDLNWQKEISHFQACAIGPGLGVNNDAYLLLKKVLTLKIPLVIDADAISLLSQNSDLLELLHSNIILTPHIGEFDRLLGKSFNHFERLKKAQVFCDEKKIVIVLKGQFTAIVQPFQPIMFNYIGSVAMAKGGSGDVLTGLIAGLLAQGYPVEAAAIVGPFIHGLAGYLGAKKYSSHSLIASELAELISDAWQLIENQKLNTVDSLIEEIS